MTWLYLIIYIFSNSICVYQMKTLDTQYTPHTHTQSVLRVWLPHAVSSNVSAFLSFQYGAMNGPILYYDFGCICMIIYCDSIFFRLLLRLLCIHRWLSFIVAVVGCRKLKLCAASVCECFGSSHEINKSVSMCCAYIHSWLWTSSNVRYHRVVFLCCIVVSTKTRIFYLDEAWSKRERERWRRYTHSHTHTAQNWLNDRWMKAKRTNQQKHKHQEASGIDENCSCVSFL